MIPPGKRIVSEQERLSTLHNLEEAAKEIEVALEQFPIKRANVNRSGKHDTQRNELETKLDKIYAAIDQFSNPPVYIKI